MKLDVCWLARLGVDQGLFTRANCITLRNELGDNLQLMDFAQALIDQGIVEDIEILETLANTAMGKALAGPPDIDPFADVPTNEYPIGNISLSSPGAPMPVVDFAEINALPDEDLRTALTELLRAGAR